MQFIYSLARIACCALLLTACAGVVPLQRGQTAGLNKQATPAEVDAFVGKATITANHVFSSQGQSWDARHYNLQTGSTQQMTMVCAPTCMPIFITVPVVDSYVLVFDSPARHLFAWGTLEELSRSPDEAVSAIMPDLKQSHALALQAKKQN
jgi:hypothetical protein